MAHYENADKIGWLKASDYERSITRHPSAEDALCYLMDNYGDEYDRIRTDRVLEEAPPG